MELNPALSKLKIQDLLVKPMHRITRYPLLFKRLQSHLSVHSPEYESLNVLVKTFESILTEVNRAVRSTDAVYTLSYLDSTLDFFGLADVFFPATNLTRNSKLSTNTEKSSSNHRGNM
jgi:hypothetical protein